MSWNETRIELERRPKTAQGGIDCDSFRREKYALVEKVTGRPLIVYATDFLNKFKLSMCRGDVEIDWSDRDGFIEVTRGLPADGVDIILYSPGGLPDAADSLVSIVRRKFKHVRYIVPAMAKSAATMMALSGDELWMEQDAEVGPIDPQFRLVKPDGSVVTSPAQAIIDQFDMAQSLLGGDPKKLVAWMPILQQYGPSLYQECLNAIALSKKYVGEWLRTGMFKNMADKDANAQKVVDYLANHNEFKSHGARVGVAELQARGVDVKVLNDDNKLHDAVMAAFYSVMQTFALTGAFRVTENSRGAAYLRVVVAQPQAPQRVPGPAPGQAPGEG